MGLRLLRYVWHVCWGFFVLAPPLYAQNEPEQVPLSEPFKENKASMAGDGPANPSESIPIAEESEEAREGEKKILIRLLVPGASMIDSESQNTEKATESEQGNKVEKEGEAKEPSRIGLYSPSYFVFEPRIGWRFQIKETPMTMPLEAGLAARYPLPFWGQRLRVGMGFDWARIESGRQENQQSVGGAFRSRIDTIPILFELDCSFMELGLWRPFFGTGVGVTVARMDLEVASFTMQAEPTDTIATVHDRQDVLALAVWGGCAFNVFYGGPFMKIRYLWSEATFLLLGTKDLGGLSILFGYHWEY